MEIPTDLDARDLARYIPPFSIGTPNREKGACILTRNTLAAFSALPTAPGHDRKSPARSAPVVLREPGKVLAERYSVNRQYNRLRFGQPHQHRLMSRHMPARLNQLQPRSSSVSPSTSRMRSIG